MIGQEGAKKILAVAVYDHCKRLSTLAASGTSSGSDVDIAKSNALVIGPTGSGKTFLAEILAKIVNVPFVTADATKFTSAGYVGEDVEQILQKLLEKAGGDIEKTERGIVYVDEVDKIRNSASWGEHKDVNGGAVQQALLQMLQGSVVNVPTQAGKKQGEVVQINTANILFICGGSFDGIEKFVAERCQQSGIGFSSMVHSKDGRNKSSLIASIEPEDLLKFGMIPEFVGRLPVIATLHELDEAALMRILHEPKNALVKQQQKLFMVDNIALEFTDAALMQIAKFALLRKTGARGLRDRKSVV